MTDAKDYKIARRDEAIDRQIELLEEVMIYHRDCCNKDDHWHFHSWMVNKIQRLKEAKIV